jgi:hypothetical protein
MTKYEYKHVRVAWGLKAATSATAYDRKLMMMLQKHGEEGWDLKGVIQESPALHTHFIFGRPQA